MQSAVIQLWKSTLQKDWIT